MIHPYATERYASSLGHLGTPLAVPEWCGHVMVRPIDAAFQDAIGPYPLAVLSEDVDLAGGMERLRKVGLVSVVLVVDDYHRPSLDALRTVFDFVRPFKVHYVVDRTRGNAESSKHHRYEIKRALKTVEIRQFVLDDGHLAQCMALYELLKVRHGLDGIYDFPLTHFIALAKIDGVTSLGAFRGDELLSFHVWAGTGKRVHSHLAASSQEGYEVGAAYAVNAAAIELFGDHEIVNLGGSAGNESQNDGLAQFKSGFCNATAQSYLCGKVLDASLYERLSAYAPRSNYFPAYRGS